MNDDRLLEISSTPDDWQHAQRAGDILRFAPVAPLSTAGGCCIVAACLWPVLPQMWLSAWLGAGLFVALAQWQSQRFISGAPAGVDRRGWIIASALASGLFWGATSLALNPTGSIAHQLLFAFILVVITTLWLPLFALTRLAFVAFAVPGLLPMAFGLLASPEPPQTTMGSLLILLIGVFAAVAHTTRRIFFADVATRRELYRQATQDSLVGLANRAEFHRRAQTLEIMGDRPYAMLFLDVDHFKEVNDTAGHAAGDELLCRIGAVLKDAVRKEDLAARLGGDEFAILMEVDAPESAMRMGQRVIDALREPVRVEGKELFTGVSVGITLSSPHYTSPEDLLRDADIAMYRAKAGGRHRIEVFDEQLHEQALQLLEVESDLRRAITRQEFEPYFQPIVRLVDGAVVGYEALMRWNHPERGVLAPGAFLHVADASGSMEAIDWQVFDRTLDCIGRLLQPGQYVNLNFSPRHFRSLELDQRFLQLIASKGVSPSQVRIEVTEGALLENPEQIGQVFNRLRENGVLIALDDFGTGYSSLSYLHRFKLHTVKIDRSFISDLRLEDEGGSTAVVRAILALSRAQRLEVVAEGIETDAQRRALLSLGAEIGQGYFFAKPASLDAILAGRKDDLA